MLLVKSGYVATYIIAASPFVLHEHIALLLFSIVRVFFLFLFFFIMKTVGNGASVFVQISPPVVYGNTSIP